MNDNTPKMLQAILNGQTALKEELVSNIDKLGNRLDGRIDGLEGRMDKLDRKLDNVEKRLTKRIDKLGLQLAYLEDDAPTREEHNSLEKRVDRIEHKAVITA